MSVKKHEMDMTEGPLFKKILIFSLPLIFTGLLQCLYNAADLIVVGHFRGHIALAAVGSTGALNNLIVGLFMGISVGAGVCVAQYIGAKEHEKVSRVVQTSVLASLIMGVAVGALGFALSKYLLTLMDTPANVIEYSTLYIRIIFLGVPGVLLYNFCAAILRAAGDTRHPMIFLTISGIVNVGLNVIMVTVFGMGVEGVAIATIVSQYLSATLAVIYMCRIDSSIRIKPRELRIHKDHFFRMMKIGVPSGIQGSLFSLSNVLFQSAINGFGDVIMAGNSAAGNIESFTWIVMNAIHHTAVSFTAQNVGAKKYDRLGAVLRNCLFVVTAVWAVSAGFILLFGHQLVGLYAGNDEVVIQSGLNRMWVVISTHVICGYMDVICGALRGMGRSFTSMMLTLIFNCGVRVLWLYTVFPMFGTPLSIYVAYPVSWGLSAVANLVAFLIVLGGLKASRARELSEPTL